VRHHRPSSNAAAEGGDIHQGVVCGSNTTRWMFEKGRFSNASQVPAVAVCQPQAWTWRPLCNNHVGPSTILGMGIATECLSSLAADTLPSPVAILSAVETAGLVLPIRVACISCPRSACRVYNRQSPPCAFPASGSRLEKSGRVSCWFGCGEQQGKQFAFHRLQHPIALAITI
jgi:hypothetical protein